MSPNVRPALIVGAFAVLLSLTVSLAVGSMNRSPVILTNPTAVTTNPGSNVTTGILTSGDATVSRRPDIAYISAGVQAQASTAAGAQRNLATQANQLVARAKALGVPDTDVNTSGYAIGPHYSNDGSLAGYDASEQLTIKWHNVDNVGTALDALVQQGGATRISVSFGIADLKSAQADARAQAIADARTRATAMAKAAGVQLGPVLSVSDYTTGGQSPPSPYASAAADTTQLPVGQLQVTVVVEVAFAIA